MANAVFLSLFNYDMMTICLPNMANANAAFCHFFNYGIMTILPAKYGRCRFLSLFNYGMMTICLPNMANAVFVTFQLRHNDDD